MRWSHMALNGVIWVPLAWHVSKACWLGRVDGVWYTGYLTALVFGVTSWLGYCCGKGIMRWWGGEILGYIIGSKLRSFCLGRNRIRWRLLHMILGLSVGLLVITHLLLLHCFGNLGWCEWRESFELRMDTEVILWGYFTLLIELFRSGEDSMMKVRTSGEIWCEWYLAPAFGIIKSIKNEFGCWCIVLGLCSKWRGRKLMLISVWLIYVEEIWGIWCWRILREDCRERRSIGYSCEVPLYLDSYICLTGIGSIGIWGTRISAVGWEWVWDRLLGEKLWAMKLTMGGQYSNTEYMSRIGLRENVREIGLGYSITGSIGLVWGLLGSLGIRLGEERVSGVHGLAMVLWMAMSLIWGAWTNLAIGEVWGLREIRMERFNKLSMWLNVFSLENTILLVVGYDIGWSMYLPNGLFVRNIGVLINGIASVWSGSNIIGVGTTRERAWVGNGWMVVGIILSTVNGILGGGLVGTWIEREWGGWWSTWSLWGHIWWGWGHPEVYVLVIPMWGVWGLKRDGVSKERICSGVMFGIGGLGWMVWGHHLESGVELLEGKVFWSSSSMLIGVPTGNKWGYLWIDGWYGKWGGWSYGGLSGIVISNWGNWNESMSVVGHFHIILFGGALGVIGRGEILWIPLLHLVYKNNDKRRIKIKNNYASISIIALKILLGYSSLMG